MPPVFVVKKASSSSSPLAGIRASAGIAHAQSDTLLVAARDRSSELPRPILDARHRLGGVPQQVQDDLLQLDPIARDRRRSAAGSD